MTLRKKSLLGKLEKSGKPRKSENPGKSGKLRKSRKSRTGSRSSRHITDVLSTHASRNRKKEKTPEVILTLHYVPFPLEPEDLTDKGEIYALINWKTQKLYIGQTKCLKKFGSSYVYRGFYARFEKHSKNAFSTNLEQRHSCPKLYDAIRKDGPSLFFPVLLERCLRSELNRRERYYIKLYRTRRLGYNVTAGGQRQRKPRKRKGRKAYSSNPRK